MHVSQLNKGSKMEQVQKTALKETVITVAGLTAVAVLVPAIFYLIPLQELITIALMIMLVFGIKMIYDIKLAQAKFKQTEIDTEIDRLHK